MNASDHPEPTASCADEKARRLRIEVERLARLSTVEWMYYAESEGYAEKYGTDKAALKRMVEAVIKKAEKKQRDDAAERRRIEGRDAAKAREEERKVEKKERHDRQAEKDREKKERERQNALAAIVKLPQGEHEVRLRQLARRLGEDVDGLRDELAILLAEEEEAARIEADAPWPEPIDTKELLDGILAQLQKYIVIHDEHFAVICTLWVLFAWCHDIATYSPLLVIQAADSEAAKTNLTRAITLLTPRGLMITVPTGPALYRIVDHDHPTLGIDDADRLLPRNPDLATIVNSSWTRGTTIPRTVRGEVHYFDPFTPKALNGIDLLPHLEAPTRTRCIVGNLLPKLDDEEVTDFKYAATDANFLTLRRKAKRWAADNMAVLRDADPTLPEGFSKNRQRDNFVLLFAIADLAVGSWWRRARTAAVKLTREFNQPSLGKCLLAKFYEFAVVHGTLLASAQAEKLLAATEDPTWCDYMGKGRPITRYQIANLLRPFGPRPGNIHPRGGKTTDRGYDLTDVKFTTAFRYHLRKDLPAGRSVARSLGGRSEIPR